MFIFYNLSLQFIVVPVFTIFIVSFFAAIILYYKRSEKYFEISVISSVFSFLAMIVLIMIPTYNDADLKQGEFLSKCTVLEENIYTGTFSENVNKIECNGRIINIDISKYNLLIYAYNQENKK